jgi:hypothetical protein
MFGDNPAGNPVLIKKTCSACGCDVEVELNKTSGGFGLHGGALFETDGKIIAKCPQCYEKAKCGVD